MYKYMFPPLQALAALKAQWHATIGEKQQALSEARAALASIDRQAKAKQADASALGRKKADLSEKVEVP